MMEGLNDDIPLSEALQLIDEWDVDFAALFGLDDAPAKKRRRKLCAKDERIELLHKIEELQTRIEPTADTTSTDPLCQEWGAIAARQRQQRLALEVENEKLRTALASQLKCARRAAALVDKVNTIGMALGTDPVPTIDVYDGPHIDVREQLERLDALVVEATSLFSSDRFAGDDFRDVEFRGLEPNRLLIDLQVSWVLPFSVASIMDALWFHTTRMPRTERTTCFKDIYAAHKTLVSRFVSETRALGTIHAEQMQPLGGATHGQIATRIQSPATDGSVLLVSNMDVKNFQANGECRSLMTGNGFVQVQPLEVSGETPLCRVKWCRRVFGSAPDASPRATDQYARWVHGFTSKGMREKWWRSIEINLQAIENVLLTAQLDQEQSRSEAMAKER